jgi:hypothetical protein
MNIQGFSNAAAYSAFKLTALRADATAAASPSSISSSEAQGASTQLTLSDHAKALASDALAAQAKLEAIQAKPAVERTSEDRAFVLKNDTRLAQITAKGQKLQSAEDVAYMQKSGGFVSTMGNLSAQEKQLYDQLVARGDADAVRGMNLIAMARTGSGDVTLPNGASFNPAQTEITADSIKDLFSQMFVSTDGQDARSFDALASFLSNKPKMA